MNLHLVKKPNQGSIWSDHPYVYEEPPRRLFYRLEPTGPRNLNECPSETTANRVMYTFNDNTWAYARGVYPPGSRLHSFTVYEAARELDHPPAGFEWRRYEYHVTREALDEWQAELGSSSARRPRS